MLSINISEKKAAKKTPVNSAQLLEGIGIVGDAHADDWHRQVSLLAFESIEKMREKGLNVGPGDFAENITTKNFDLLSIIPGKRIKIGDVVLEITQHGKECHTRCAIYYQAGDCVMPREGVFARVLKSGTIKIGDPIEIINGDD